MNWLEILKWVGLVLAAGFVGYFGRYLAIMIIEKLRKDKTTSSSVSEPSASPDIQIEEIKAKREKKRVKTEAKNIKKKGKK